MKAIKISLFLVGILSTMSLNAASGDEEKHKLLQSLSRRNIAYSEEIPVDSVIAWGEQLETVLEQEGRNRELFELKLLITNAYCSRGDISLAVNKVHEMLQKAKEMNESYFGSALASLGIGDTYTASNMARNALESYEEALDILDRLPSAIDFKKRVLLQVILALLQEDNAEKAAPYVIEINNLIPIPDPESDVEKDPLLPLLTIYNAYYYTQIGELNKAKSYLDAASVLVQDEKENPITITLDFLKGYYYEKKGKYNLAFIEFDKFTPEIQKKLDPNRYADFTAHKAQLLVKMGSINEACLLYQQMNALKDSLSTKSYARQINQLHMIYKVNQIELENQTQRNKQNHSFIVIAICLLIIIIVLAVYIKLSNKQLSDSKQKLEKAKTHADDSVKAKSMILSNMSHEIRTPLNALTGFSAILTEDSIDSATRQQCNEIIQQNSELLLKLINDVIDLSSLEFGKMQFNFKDSDAVVICRNVVETVEKIKQTSADILFRTSLDSLILYTDEARLQQVLINLLINATKFTPSGSITLELELKSKGIALLTVTDTGCGIPLERQKQIFNRFEKLDELAQGTGLGLSISQLIVMHFGGKIWIDPQYAEGSRFCFTHPIKNQQAQP